MGWVESKEVWNDEQTYLKDNPDKHKVNFYCTKFVQLISKNGNKVSDIDLKKCVKFYNDEQGESMGEIPAKFSVPHQGIQEDWITKYVENVDYVKPNAMIHYLMLDGKPVGLILGYINERGIWVGEIGVSTSLAAEATPHKIDEGILNALPQIFDDGSSVVDFGCGNADYIRDLISKGFKCEAYDGNPDTPRMTGGIGKVLDLSEEFDLKKKFDYVISLEVAEHIPEEYEETYVDNLIRHTGNYLITSWAVKGQGGDGHVNEQDEDYVLNMYKEKGMTYNKEVSEALRNVATLGWFKKTIFVFSIEENLL